MSVTAGERIWALQTATTDESAGGSIRYRDEDGDDRHDLVAGEWLPDSPALIPVARWLAATDHAAIEEALSAAVVGLEAWIEGLRDNGTRKDIEDAIELEANTATVRALIAALEEGTR